MSDGSMVTGSGGDNDGIAPDVYIFVSAPQCLAAEAGDGFCFCRAGAAGLTVASDLISVTA